MANDNKDSNDDGPKIVNRAKGTQIPGRTSGDDSTTTDSPPAEHSASDTTVPDPANTDVNEGDASGTDEVGDSPSDPTEFQLENTQETLQDDPDTGSSTEPSNGDNSEPEGQDLTASDLFTDVDVNDVDGIINQVRKINAKAAREFQSLKNENTELHERVEFLEERNAELQQLDLENVQINLNSNSPEQLIDSLRDYDEDAADRLEDVIEGREQLKLKVQSLESTVEEFENEPTFDIQNEEERDVQRIIEELADVDPDSAVLIKDVVEEREQLKQKIIEFEVKSQDASIDVGDEREDESVVDIKDDIKENEESGDETGGFVFIGDDE